MIYEWDLDKTADNERKHAVSFDEAETVFLNTFTETFDDPDHSVDERRFMTIGLSTRPRLPFIAHVERGAVRVRIISARVATRGEHYGLSRTQHRAKVTTFGQSTTCPS
ncbi:MAG: BrnT family toxin [Acidobacteria bacterium]|nr:BrnT family toxin [Acidobacteriota bacterium]